MTRKSTKTDAVSFTYEGNKVNSQSVTSSPNPIGQSWQWIKLWVNPWLDGTTRFEMSGSQRAFWVDLLAEAGRSRFPGIVCPGTVNEKILGYPVIWYQVKQPDIDVMATLKLFAATGKIAITITNEQQQLIAVEILNWRKYQSDLESQAQRARKYREKKRTAE
jgi:hypothetical protein